MTVEQLPRNSLFWILISLLAVIVPHAARLPIWLLLALVAVTIWRIQVHRGIWSYPNRWVKWLLAFSSIVGLWLTYGASVSLEPMVALLIFSLMLKLLEMYRRRDAQTVIFLGFFVIATQWLFYSGVAAFLYGILCLFLLLMALLALQLPSDSDVKARATSAKQSQSVDHPLWVQGKTLAWMLLFSLPMMLLLFLFFPKVGALWAVPQIKPQAQTGVSDRMSPGDLSSLSRRGGRAFTVEFSGELPAPQQLYWRGMVLSQFDGRTWTRSQWSGQETRSVTVLPDDLFAAEADKQRLPNIQSPPNTPTKTEYRVTLEPHHQTWLYALPKVLGVPAHIRQTGEWTLLNDYPVDRRIRYVVRSRISAPLEETLSDNQRQRYLLLPVGFNPKTRKVAKQWRRDGLNDRQIVRRFLQQVADEFTYTLEPPILGRHTVDEFLWQTQRGFCEHFASSFTVFMRASGIPARVVVGYQGGEPVADFWQVTQADAHAWAEVWLAGEGWVRVDPTASVAPERVEQGIRDVFERPVLNPLSLEAYRHIPMLNRLRLQMDILNHRWQQQVLNFQSQEQKALVSRVKNYYKKLSIKDALLFLLVLGIVAGGFFIVHNWRKRQKTTLAVRLLRRWERLLGSKGVIRQEHEGIRSFSMRAGDELPSLSKDIQRIGASFDQYLYQENEKALAPLKCYLLAFSKKLKTAG